MKQPVSLQHGHRSGSGPRWVSDPLGEYRWIDIGGPLSRVADALWIFGEKGQPVSNQILVPHWKLCLAVIRKWNTVTGKLDDAAISLLGPVETSRINGIAQGAEIIAMRLHPEAAQRLLGVRPTDIVDQDPMFDPRGGMENIRRLAESGAPANAVGKALAEHLWSMLPDAEGQTDDTAVAARMMRQTHGSRPIKAIAGELGIAERTLRRRFVQDVGLSPKQYSRRLRLMKTLLRADRIRAPDWADLAIQQGYFDQSHMIEDTRLMTGTSLSTLHAMRRGETCGLAPSPREPRIR